MTGVPAWTKLFRALLVALVIGLSVAIFFLRDQFARLASVGYGGIFLVSLLGNATIVLPAPSLGLAAGVGEALGELTGYAAGYGGRAVIENQATYEKLVGWMRRRGGITILVLSIVPNPFFDIAGIAAGSLRYPIWRFLLFCWLGKTIKTVLVAYAGAYSLNVIQPLLG